MADLKGLKRICMSCGARFYDLNKKPIICPNCTTEFTGEIKVKSRRGRLPVDSVQPEADDEVESQEIVADDESEEIEEDAETVSLDEIEEDDDDADEDAIEIDDADLDDLDDEDLDDLDDDIEEDIAEDEDK